MTKQEAIRILEQSCPKRPQKLWSIKRKKAVKMAIEALQRGLENVNADSCSEKPNRSDLISRQAAIDAFNTNIDELVVSGKENADAVERYLNRVIDEIKQLPPIQSIQPKRGKWIKTARWGRVYYCNQCRNYLDFDGVNAGRGSTNFCPNCGAKMEVTE